MATAFGRMLTNARASITSLVSIVEKRTVVRARDLYRSGIHPETLSRALERGLLLKIGRGLYARKDFSADFERQIMLGLTIADCLEYRKKRGGNLAGKVQRESIARRKCSEQRLRHFAKICRVGKLVQAAYSLVASA